MNRKSISYSVACGIAAVGMQAAQAQDQDVTWTSDVMGGVTVHQTDPMADYTIYGVDGQTGDLVKYAFADHQFKAIDPIHLEGGHRIYGIEAMAHFPGHSNVMGFWTDPNDELTKLLYISSETAQATVVGQDLGRGQVTCATVAGLTDDTGNLDGYSGRVTGYLNINPNNNLSNEFKVFRKEAEGQAEVLEVSRDELKDLGPRYDLNGGVYKSGLCTRMVIQSKGGRQQSTLMVGDHVVAFKNDHRYEIKSVDVALPFEYTVRSLHSNGNAAAMGQWVVEVSGESEVTVNDLTGAGLFVLQTVEAEEDESVEFEIQNGLVVPSEPFAAKVTVLGAAITAGGAYDIPVTTQFRVQDTLFEPFGDFDLAVSGNVNDDYSHSFIFPSIHNAGTPISLVAKSWIKTSSRYNGKKDSHWTPYMAVDATVGSPNVLALRHGDQAPNIQAFMNQTNVVDFIRDFIDPATNTIKLDENQVVYLLELGTQELDTTAADFQDLVVLVTLAKNSDDFNEADDDDALAGPASRLVKVNKKTGGMSQVMTLDRVYKGLAANSMGIFYGTHGQDLYEIDPYAQTETLVGQMPGANVAALEAVGASVLGFSGSTGKLMPLNVKTGKAAGSDVYLGVADLQTLVFMEQKMFSQAYD